jgi:hypothetical protein
MNDDVQVILILCMIFAFLSMLKGFGASRRQRKLQRMIDEMQARPVAPTPPALPGASREQVQRLEERVRVLERIVTDSGYTLANEIEALRDSRPASSRRSDTVEENTQ